MKCTNVPKSTGKNTPTHPSVMGQSGKGWKRVNKRKTMKYVKMLQTAYWLKKPKCKYPK